MFHSEGVVLSADADAVALWIPSTSSRRIGRKISIRRSRRWCVLKIAAAAFGILVLSGVRDVRLGFFLEYQVYKYEIRIFSKEVKFERMIKTTLFKVPSLVLHFSQLSANL